MRKLEREITKTLRRFPRWRFTGTGRGGHLVITDGARKIFASSTPKNVRTEIKNLRQRIRRAEQGLAL